jgi:hypothetical protein
MKQERAAQRLALDQKLAQEAAQHANHMAKMKSQFLQGEQLAAAMDLAQALAEKKGHARKLLEARLAGKAMERAKAAHDYRVFASKVDAIDREVSKSYWAGAESGADRGNGIQTLTDEQVHDFTKTGKWPALKRDLTMDWKGDAKVEATRTAKEGYDNVTQAARQAGIQPWSGLACMSVLLKACEPGIVLTTSLVEEFTRVAGEQMMGMICSAIPIVNTFIAAYGAVSAANAARNLHNSLTEAQGTAGFLRRGGEARPETPGAAMDAVLEALAYYRNIKVGEAATNASKLLATALDPSGGAIAAPWIGLAGVAISVHKLYRAMMELNNYNAARHPYSALRGSGTMGAHVLLWYPAIGLIEEGETTDGDFIPVGQHFYDDYLGLKGQSPLAMKIRSIRKAASRVLDESHLEVGVQE